MKKKVSYILGILFFILSFSLFPKVKSGVDVGKILESLKENSSYIKSQRDSLEGKLLKKALEFYNNGFYKKAFLLTQRIIERMPQSYRAYFLLYKIKEKLGEEDSLFYLKKAKLIYDSLRKEEKLSLSQLDNAFFSEFNDYLESNDISYKFYERAMKMLEGGSWSRAASLLEEAISLKKKPFYFFKLADVYVDMGEEELGIKYYKEGLLLEDNPQAEFKLINLLFKKQRFSELKPYLEDLYRRNPQQPQVRAMYEYVEKHTNQKETFQNQNLSDRKSLVFYLDKVQGRDLYFRTTSLQTLDYRDFIFKKFYIYDKMSKVKKGKILFLGEKEGVFKAFLLTGNPQTLQKGDLVKVDLD